jgi:hypothetical protein
MNEEDAVEIRTKLPQHIIKMKVVETLEEMQ